MKLKYDNQPAICFLLISIFVAPYGTQACADDIFNLVNSHPRAVKFEFYSTENRDWISSSGYVRATTGSMETVLVSEKPHYFQFYVDGYRQPVGTFDFHEIVHNSQGMTISLDLLYVTEERSRMVPQTSFATQQQTRMVTVIRTRQEQRTRTETRIDPNTGQQYTVEVPYTVEVSYTEQIPQQYTVQIPQTTMVEERYTVQVPRIGISVPGQGELKPIDTGQQVDLDNRKRYFGASFQQGQNGVLVTSAASGSPAASFKRVGGNDSELFSFRPGIDELTHINGREVKTVADAERAIQESHFVMEFTVREPQESRIGNYQVQLHMLRE